MSLFSITLLPFVFSHLSALLFFFFVPLIHSFSVFLPFIYSLFALCPLSVCRSQAGFCRCSTICRTRQRGREDGRRKRQETVTEEDEHKESDSLTNKTNLTAEKRKKPPPGKKKSLRDGRGNLTYNQKTVQQTYSHVLCSKTSLHKIICSDTNTQISFRHTSSPRQVTVNKDRTQ